MFSQDNIMIKYDNMYKLLFHEIDPGINRMNCLCVNCLWPKNGPNEVKTVNNKVISVKLIFYCNIKHTQYCTFVAICKFQI